MAGHGSVGGEGTEGVKDCWRGYVERRGAALLGMAGEGEEMSVAAMGAVLAGWLEQGGAREERLWRGCSCPWCRAGGCSPLIKI